MSKKRTFLTHLKRMKSWKKSLKRLKKRKTFLTHLKRMKSWKKSPIHLKKNRLHPEDPLHEDLPVEDHPHVDHLDEDPPVEAHQREHHLRKVVKMKNLSLMLQWRR
jgi:hypothetical protein